MPADRASGDRTAGEEANMADTHTAAGSAPPPGPADPADQELLDRRLAEAANPATGPQRLAELVVDANWLVRRNVVMNPAVTPVALGLLADDDNQITRSLVAEHPLASPATLERLAGDPEPVVRAAAAARHDCPAAARAHAGLLAD